MLNKINILAVIPARYASSRLPGKLLMKLGDRSILECVYHQIKDCSILDRVIVATDDQRIYDHVQGFGAEVVMTSANHTSGTERCIAVFNGLEIKYDYLINVQGDEPFLDADEIVQLIELMIRNSADVGTLAYPIDDVDELYNPNLVKVVRSKSNKALYFSRSVIPFHSKYKLRKMEINALQHIGLYAFQKNVIPKISEMKDSQLENFENLEQLKWLENDISIVVGDALKAHIGIDTYEDLEAARKLHKDYF